jgi:hypothetical protein
MGDGTAFDRLVEALSADPLVSESQMFGWPCLKIGGKVFATGAGDDLVVKLPRERVEALIASGVGQPFDPGMGRVMKEWALIGSAEQGTWVALAEEARDFVASKS